VSDALACAGATNDLARLNLDPASSDEAHRVL
jgi:hypothetical protein